MNITKFIEQLEKIKAEHGDICVNVLEPEYLAKGDIRECQAHICLSCDENDKVKAVNIVDSETYMAFKD